MPGRRKTILFAGKRLPVLNITVLQRHSYREPVTNIKKHRQVALTPRGKKAAFFKGTKLPKDYGLKVYYSSADRAKQTARLLRQGYLAAGGEAHKFRKPAGEYARRTELDEPDYLVRHYAFLLKRLTELKGNEALLVREWIDGKLAAAGIPPAKELADNLIRKRFGLTEEVTRKGIVNKQLINVSHDWVIAPVFERLTGQKFTSLGKGLTKPLEGMAMYHTADGRAILEYRKKKFDVTARLRKILANEQP